MQEPANLSKRAVNWRLRFAIGITILLLAVAGVWFLNPFAVLPHEVAVINVGEPINPFTFVDDETLIAGGLDGSVYRIKAFPSESYELLGETGDRVYSVISITDKSAFAVGTEHGEVFVFNLDGSIRHQWKASEGGMVTSLAYSPERELLLVAAHKGVDDWGMGGQLSLWSLATGERTAFRETTDHTPTGVDIDDRRGVAVVGIHYHRVSIVSLDDLSTLLEAEIESIDPEYSLHFYDLSLNSDGSLISVAASDSVIVLDRETLEEVARHPMTEWNEWALSAVWNSNIPDEIIYCGHSCGVVRWNHVTDKAIQLADETLSLRRLDISPSGRYLAISRGGIRIAEIQHHN